jgi:hypothetical protein
METAKYLVPLLILNYIISGKLINTLFGLHDFHMISFLRFHQLEFFYYELPLVERFRATNILMKWTTVSYFIGFNIGNSFWHMKAYALVTKKVIGTEHMFRSVPFSQKYS